MTRKYEQDLHELLVNQRLASAKRGLRLSQIALFLACVALSIALMKAAL